MGSPGLPVRAGLRAPVSAAFETEVAVVGGGPAGAAVAAHLASAGRDVVVLERLASPSWRACGVYTSPLTRRRLAGLGMPAGELERLIRPISAMSVETADGKARCRLEYPVAQHGVRRRPRPPRGGAARPDPRARRSRIRGRGGAFGRASYPRCQADRVAGRWRIDLERPRRRRRRRSNIGRRACRTREQDHVLVPARRVDRPPGRQLRRRPDDHWRWLVHRHRAGAERPRQPWPGDGRGRAAAPPGRQPPGRRCRRCRPYAARRRRPR